MSQNRVLVYACCGVRVSLDVNPAPTVIAQLVERTALNRVVEGSIPSGGIENFHTAKLFVLLSRP